MEQMPMTIPVLIISMLLFFVLFFGIGFIANMLLRKTWFTAIAYPIIAILIIDKVRIIDYFTDSSNAFRQLGERFVSLQPSDIIILICGLIGAIVAGITMKTLRNRGYRMF